MNRRYANKVTYLQAEFWCIRGSSKMDIFSVFDIIDSFMYYQLGYHTREQMLIAFQWFLWLVASFKCWFCYFVFITGAIAAYPF